MKLPEQSPAPPTTAARRRSLPATDLDGPSRTGRASPAPRVGPALAARLQSQAGNKAVSRLIAQRSAAAPAKTAASGRGGSGPAATLGAATTVVTDDALEPVDRQMDAGPLGASEKPAPVALRVVQRLAGAARSVGADPKFKALKGDIKAKQQKLAAHPPAQQEAAKAQAAAKAPPDDKLAQGKQAQAEKMNAAKPGEFNKAAFIKAVNDAITQQAPKNLDDADKFADSGKADAVKQQVTGKVAEGKSASAGPITTTTTAAPDTSGAKEKAVTPLRPEPAPGVPATPNPHQAVPDKAPPEATDFSAGPAQVKDQMADAQVTEEQLAKSNEPEFTGALVAKKEGEVHAATAPGKVRTAEAQTLATAKGQAAQSGSAAMASMTSTRKVTGALIGGKKEGAKGSDEAKRAQVTATLQKVFDSTKTAVEAILNGIDNKVDAAFNTGEKQARDAFTAEHKKRMEEYKDRRYSGLLGKGRWLKDKFAGLPAEANQIFVTARAGYVTRMQQVISSVADIIATELNRAKARIAEGRTQLQAEVDKLPKDLQAIGKQAAGEFAGKFDELTESVNSKGDELVQTLANKYTEALGKVDEEIEAEKEKNKGLVAKAVDAVGGVIKTILELKDLLLGVLAKAAEAVMAIIKDPIGFLGHLVSAVGAGLQAFMAKIGDHLKNGLVSWLLGAAGSMGLQLPEKFDLRGIIMMIAQMLGMTWEAIKGRVISRGVPAQAIEGAQESLPLIAKLKDGGIGAVWEDIKERVGDLKDKLFEKIAGYIGPEVLKAGIMWILSLLNPASAFVKACKMIIDIISFIVTRGAQIAQFVSAVLDAVIAIAKGGVGGVPQLIENALAKSVPVLIGALAAILGVSGIADKVKKFFMSLTKPVMSAVDWITDKIVGVGKKIWGKIKAGAGRLRDRATGRGRNSASTAQENTAMSARPTVEVPFAMVSTPHRLIYRPAGNSVELYMASRELPITTKFQETYNAIDNFRHYIESIEDPDVKNRLRDGAKAILNADPPTQLVNKFKTLYKQEFVHGRPTGQQQEDLLHRTEGLLAQLVAWGAQTGLADLSRESVEKTLAEKGQAAWHASWLSTKGRIDSVIAACPPLAGSPLKYRGSLVQGERGLQKGKIHFDANDFDVDLFVVSRSLYQRYVRERRGRLQYGKIFPTIKSQELFSYSNDVVRRLTTEFPNIKRLRDSEVVLRER